MLPVEVKGSTTDDNYPDNQWYVKGQLQEMVLSDIFEVLKRTVRYRTLIEINFFSL